MGRRLILIFIIPLIFFLNSAWATRQHPEKYYQKKWCQDHNGRIEIKMPDNTRCDCLTDSHTIEFDFGNKWAEAIGQSLHYSFQTGKKPGIVLILEATKDQKYWIRLNSIIQYFDLNIDTWKIQLE